MYPYTSKSVNPSRSLIRPPAGVFIKKIGSVKIFNTLKTKIIFIKILQEPEKIDKLEIGSPER